MGIVQLPTLLAGEVGVFPQMKRMVTTDSLATITTAGYMNAVNLQSNPLGTNDILEVLYAYNEVTHFGTFGIFTVSISNGVITLVQWANPGDVLLPVVDGDFATFNGTTGQIKDAGFSPSDATKTKVVMAGSAVVANRIAHFVDTAGTVDDTAAAVSNLGNISAGASGTAGTFISFPSTASNGSFILASVGNAGNFNATFSPVSTLGQASVYTAPDPANALARFLVGATATPFTSGNFPVASGTGGLMVDSGLAASNIQNKTNIKAATTANIGGAGAGPISVVVAGLTTASVVVATVEASSNAASVIACTATGTGFDVTFSADPGATCTLNYVAFLAAQ